MQLFNPLDLDLNCPIIYTIVDYQNDRFYIGSSIRGAKHRFKEHLRALSKHTHANHWLQSSFDTSQLVLMPIEIVVFDEAILVEQSYLNQYFDRQVRCMNLLAKADSWLGKKHSEESKAKISKANKGRKLPSIGLANKARTISLETRNKLSATHRGRKRGPSKQKGMPGHPHTEETKQHLSMRGRKNYRLCAPDGEAFEIRGLLKFCRANQLDASALIRVGQGKQKAHKGWGCVLLD